MCVCVWEADLAWSSDTLRPRWAMKASVLWCRGPTSWSSKMYVRRHTSSAASGWFNASNTWASHVSAARECGAATRLLEPAADRAEHVSFA